MVDAIVRRTISYTLQDQRCKRCKQLKSENLRVHCNCSGDYEMGETKADLLRRLKVTKKIADFHDLPALQVGCSLPLASVRHADPVLSSFSFHSP